MYKRLIIAGLLASSLLSACGGTSKYVVNSLCVDDPARFIESAFSGDRIGYLPLVLNYEPYVALLWSDGTFSVAKSPRLKWNENTVTSEYDFFKC